MATCIFTSMNVPYGVLSSVMTNKQNERALLSISRASLGALGVFVISSYAPDLVEKFGGGPAGWQKTFLLVGIVSIGLFLITFLGCKSVLVPVLWNRKQEKNLLYPYYRV